MSTTAKRALALFLTVPMILGMAACAAEQDPPPSSSEVEGSSASSSDAASPEGDSAGNFNPTGYPIVNDPVTITVCGPLNAMTPTWEGVNLYEHLTATTGIGFEFEEYSADVWKEKKSLMFASNDLPDLFVGADFNAREMSEYGRDGQIIALNELIDAYGENIKAAFEQVPDAKAMSTSGDDNLYTLPLINQMPRDMHSRFWISETWLKNVGMEIPTTLDELYEVLKAFAEQDANGNGDSSDEVPLTGYSGSTIDGLVLNALGVNASAIATDSGATNAAAYQMVAGSDGKVACLNTLPAYKEYLLYMNRLYQEGLLDNDLFVQTQEQMEAKGNDHRLGVFFSPASYMTCGSEIGYEYTQFDALTSALSDVKMTTASPGVLIGKGAITSANPYPEATLRLMDYCYSEEGSIVNRNGEEGVGWEWTDKAAGTWENLQPEGYDNTQAWRAMVTAIDAFPSWYRVEYQLGQGSQNAIWLNEMTDRFSYAHFVMRYPDLSFSDADFDEMAPIINDVTTYIAEARARFITGEDDIEKSWDSYVETIGKMGIQKVIDIHQPAYDQYMASMK